jgi:hypothetical protein
MVLNRSRTCILSRLLSRTILRTLFGDSAMHSCRDIRLLEQTILRAQQTSMTLCLLRLSGMSWQPGMGVHYGRKALELGVLKPFNGERQRWERHDGGASSDLPLAGSSGARDRIATQWNGRRSAKNKGWGSGWILRRSFRRY